MKIERITNIESVYDFLEKNKNDFPISLDKKVNIFDYVNKLVKHGVIIGVRDNSSLKGIIAGYCNDNKTYKGYISIIVIDKSCRGNGCGKKLLSSFVDACVANKMNSIFVYTNCCNKPAIKLYENNNFIICGKRGIDYKLIREL